MQIQKHLRHLLTSFRLSPKKKIYSAIVVTGLILGSLIPILAILDKETNIQSKAANMNVLEPENGVLTGTTTVVNDTSASGGKYVQFGTTAGQAPFPLWVEPALVRIGKSDQPKTQIQADLHAGKGEYESFQIAVRASSSALANVNVSTSDLTNGSGGTIAKSNITLYREHFANIAPSSPNWGGSNQPGPAGLYADGLIPFAHPDTGADLVGGTLDAAPFSVGSGTNEVVWVDIFVPRSTPAGTYTGTFTITSNQGTGSVPVSLQVWNFTLPVKPSEQSSFLIWTARSKANEEELLKHKIMPAEISTLANESDLQNRLGLAAVDLGFWSGADVSNCTMNNAPSVSQFQSAAAQHAAGLHLYNYTADEIGGSCASSLAPKLKQWAANLHQAGIDNLVTMAPDPQFYDDGTGSGRSAVDIWTILPKQHNASNIQTVLNKGDEVWSYNSLVQDAYTPKWLIDFRPIDPRLQAGFINASLGYTGLLYWRVDFWGSDPWNNPNNTGQFSSGNYPGDGLLVYPGDKVGLPGRVVPSMRLKQLRDGVEDYEYVKLLKNAGQGPFALQVSQSVGANWTNWTKDPNALYSARNQLGEKLNSL